MSAEQLITQHIDTWTSALQTRSSAGRGNNGKVDLYGIKKLRELILELAVRGKLVPQDPNDEPASELLKRIAAEKAELVKQGKIKKQKSLPEIGEDEKPFELPVSWEWSRLPNISNYQIGKTPPTKDSSFWSTEETGTPWVSIADLNQNGYIQSTFKKVTDKAKELSFSYPPVKAGTILMSFKLTVGKVSILQVEAFHNEAIISISELSGIEKYYLFYVLPLISHFGKTKKAIMGNTLNSESLSMLVLPIPPQQEQKRIILKYKELMSLCDQLEQQSLTSLEAHSQLVNTLLATLTNSQNAEELAENWTRISQHFDTLFTNQASIDALKQTILQLAVMGKLVPQDPNDEPASELLKRIEQEKAQLVKKGKIKKQKPLQPVSDEERPFDLPEGWEWVRFGSVINIRAELVKPENHYNSLQVAPDIIEKGTGKVLSKRTVKESGVKGPNSKFYKNQIVYSKIRPSLSKAFIAEYDGLCSADMYPIDCFINSEYLLKVILSEVFLIQVRAAENRIKMPKLNVDSLSNILIPVPPAKVQSVISDRINEMHISSDLLKTRLQSAQQTQLHLADALTDAALS